MGASGWGTKHSVRDRLFDEGYRFEFYQAVRLLEMMFADGASVGEGADPEREPVRFKSRADLAFPATDVVEITPPVGSSGNGRALPGVIEQDAEAAKAASNGQQNGHGPVTMTVNFMGLAGHLGPLPSSYTELILDRAWQRDTAFRDFLDIFNHRLISILYRVRKHHHIGFDVASPDQTHVASYLYAMAGLGTAGLKQRMDVEDRALLRYTGLLTQKPRSATGLEAILSDYFHLPVRVRQYVGRWRTLEDHQTTYIASTEDGTPRGRPRGRMQNNILGRSAVLGDHVWQQDGQFDLHLGLLSLPDYLDFLPTGIAHRSLSELTRFYVNQDADFNFVLKLKPEEAPVSKLGTLMGPRLGWTSWLTRPPEAGSDGAPPDEHGHGKAASDFEVTITPRFVSAELQKLRLPFLAGLSPDALQIVLDHVRPARSYQEGMVIAREEDAAEATFIIDTGSVSVLRAEQGKSDVVLATLTEGDFFGETTLQKGKRYLNTFVAAERCEIFELTHRELEDHLMKEHPAVARAVEVFRRKKGLDRDASRYERLVQKLQALRSPLFAELPLDGLSEVSERITLFGLPPGAVVVRQGDFSKALYIISKGTARMDARLADGSTQTLATLGKGDFFGEMEMLYGERNFATVTTISAAEVIELTRGSLAQIIARYPPVEHVLRAVYHRRLTELARVRHGR